MELQKPSQSERIRALERELHQTRMAAVHMLMGVSDAIASTPDGREDLARGFEEAAAQADAVTARLARLVAQALRDR